MKSIGVHSCLIPLSKGERHQPNFPLDFSLPKLRGMFTVKVDHYEIISNDFKIIKVGSDGQIDGYPTLKVSAYTIDSFLFHTQCEHR